jgi:hypothetical protein
MKSDKKLHSCLRNIDQHARVGDRTRREILLSVNEEGKFSEKNRGYELFDRLFTPSDARIFVSLHFGRGALLTVQIT